MHYTLASITADPAGHIEIPVDADASIGETRRRVNRVATLDGSAVSIDAGFTDADRTLDLSWVPDSLAREQAVDRLVRLYPQAHIVTREGCFLVALETYKPGAEQSTLRALVLEKLSA